VTFFRETEAFTAARVSLLEALEDYAARATLPLKGLVDHCAFVFAVDTPPDGTAMPEGCHHRGAEASYPCSLVKLFHLVAAEQALADGRILPHAELSRALDDMILWSSNTATNYVIDILTGTTGDTLLDETALTEWINKRLGLNAFFRSWDWAEFADLNLSQKLMDDQRYGREHQFLSGPRGAHNRLSPFAVARLMHRIASERYPPLAGRPAMLRRLARDLESPLRARPAYQVDGYLAAGLPAGTDCWSKAGHNRWTGDPAASFYRHDTLWAALPNGAFMLLTVFTQGEALSERDDFLPYVAECAFDIALRHCSWAPRRT